MTKLQQQFKLLLVVGCQQFVVNKLDNHCKGTLLECYPCSYYNLALNCYKIKLLSFATAV